MKLEQLVHLEGLVEEGRSAEHPALGLDHGVGVVREHHRTRGAEVLGVACRAASRAMPVLLAKFEIHDDEVPGAFAL